MKRFVISLLILLSPLFLRAQENLTKELKQYTQQEILPVLRKQRSLLESSLNSDEQETLKQLRWEFKEVLTADERLAFDITDYEPGRMIFYFGTHQELIEELLYEAWEIAKNHEAQIDRLLQPIKSKSKKWQTDWKAIKAKYPKEVQKNREALGGFDGKFKRVFIPAFFALWSPEGLVFDLATSDQLELTFEINPNPLNGNYATLLIDVDQPGTYQISIVSDRGNSEWSRSLQFDYAGKVEEELDLIDLSNGDYFIRVANKSSAAVLRFQKVSTAGI